MPKKPHEEHENAERYLITYADLITLLLGLFVILYASSKADTPKYIAVSAALRNFFNGSGRVIDNGGARGGLLENLPNPSNAGGEISLTQLQLEISDALTEVATDSITEDPGPQAHAPAVEATSDSIRMELEERGLVIHLAESMFFDSGKAVIKKEGLAALDKVAGELKGTNHSIRVEGHTDDTPIYTARFPSNWHLSAVRAINTAMYLVDKHKISNTRLSVAGYGEFRPLTTNDTPQNRKKNRRVDLVILSETAVEQEPAIASYKPEQNNAAAPPPKPVPPPVEETPLDEPQILILPEHKANPLLNPKPADRAIN